MGSILVSQVTEDGFASGHGERSHSPIFGSHSQLERRINSPSQLHRRALASTRPRPVFQALSFAPKYYRSNSKKKHSLPSRGIGRLRVTYPAKLSLFFVFWTRSEFLKSGADADEAAEKELERLVVS